MTLILRPRESTTTTTTRKGGGEEEDSHGEVSDIISL